MSALCFLGVSYVRMWREKKKKKKNAVWSILKDQQRAELCYCLMLSSEPGLCAQQGSNGSSVCTLTISLHIWRLSKALLTSTQWLRLVHSSRPASSMSAVSLISKYNNRGGFYHGDFGAELNSIPRLMSYRISQMVKGIGCIDIFTNIWSMVHQPGIVC